MVIGKMRVMLSNQTAAFDGIAVPKNLQSL
jgi:hypothetical protein